MRSVYARHYAASHMRPVDGPHLIQSLLLLNDRPYDKSKASDRQLTMQYQAYLVCCGQLTTEKQICCASSDTTGDLPASQGGMGRGLVNTDVVNDAAKSACVRVEGSLNGQPFVVERTVARCAADVDHHLDPLTTRALSHASRMQHVGFLRKQPEVHAWLTLVELLRCIMERAIIFCLHASAP